MASSKNAKKRKSKSQKRQQNTRASSVDNSASQNVSPTRSISPITSEEPVKESEEPSLALEVQKIPATEVIIDNKSREETQNSNGHTSVASTEATPNQENGGDISDKTSLHESQPINEDSRQNNLATGEGETDKSNTRNSGVLLPAFDETLSPAPHADAAADSVITGKNAPVESGFNKNNEDHDEYDFEDAVEPVIPQRSIARDIESEVVMLEAKRQPVSFARPVMLTEVNPASPDLNKKPQEETQDNSQQAAGLDVKPVDTIVASGLTNAGEAIVHNHENEPELDFGQDKDVQTNQGTASWREGSSNDVSPKKTETKREDDTTDLSIDDDAFPSETHGNVLEGDGIESPQAPAAPGPELDQDLGEFDTDFDPDAYFSGPEDTVVTAGPPYNTYPPESEAPLPSDWPLGASSPSSQNEKDRAETRISDVDDVDRRSTDSVNKDTDDLAAHQQDDMHSDAQDHELDTQRSQPGMIRRVDEQTNEPLATDISLAPETNNHYTPLQSPLASPSRSIEATPQQRISQLSLDDSPVQSPSHYAKWMKKSESNSRNGNGNGISVKGTDELKQHILMSPPRLAPDLSSPQVPVVNDEPLYSPTASPRPYKYAQSPLPQSATETAEPPIFGVCVVGFHHKRGPEVEYWVGPKQSNSNMWPYLPFQSLPDGSHQFEENICYFTLLYDRNKCTSTSLTFLRDEEGHIKEGTSDFRDVTTLFAIACSRQVPLSELTHIGEDEEYTRSVVQKSVVVIASKPIFGPIKEKLRVVTRSFFNQRNFNDKTIIDHFYSNLVQMPLWANDNDSQVGMNLQRCVQGFGVQVLTILKAMLLELKILFYSNDTDILGTTQFALISLVPNLINHLEDCGSPLLSSYELTIQPAHTLKSSDRNSLLNYAGFPLQLFAAGGVLAPFVPLQQFEDLKQPETKYGMFGTANNLFLGNEIDFDVVVNVDTHEIQIRNNEVAPLLKLTDADRAFALDVTSAVNQAWDSEEKWHPQSLGYYGGEDYIRHEFEEYLIALLSSAKYAKSLLNRGSDAGSASTKSSTTDERDSAAALQPWGKAWTEKWMSSTNNFRIFDQHVDPGLFHLINRAHPGLKLLKPSGFEKFLGFFKPKPPASPSVRRGSGLISGESQSPVSSSSNPQTPSLESGDKFDSPVPSTPSSGWFRRREDRN